MIPILIGLPIKPHVSLCLVWCNIISDIVVVFGGCGCYSSHRVPFFSVLDFRLASKMQPVWLLFEARVLH